MKGLCAIISGGEYSPMDDIKAAEYIIACDRGYSYAKRSGIVPDLLLGDFDSYTGKLPEGRGSRTPAAGKRRHGHDARGTPRAGAGLYAYQPLLRARRAARPYACKPPGRILCGGARSAGAAVQPRLRGVYLLRRERPASRRARAARCRCCRSPTGARA